MSELSNVFSMEIGVSLAHFLLAVEEEEEIGCQLEIVLVKSFVDAQSLLLKCSLFLFFFF